MEKWQISAITCLEFLLAYYDITPIGYSVINEDTVIFRYG